MKLLTPLTVTAGVFDVLSVAPVINWISSPIGLMVMTFVGTQNGGSIWGKPGVTMFCMLLEFMPFIKIAPTFTIRAIHAENEAEVGA